MDLPNSCNIFKLTTAEMKIDRKHRSPALLRLMLFVSKKSEEDRQAACRCLLRSSTTTLVHTLIHLLAGDVHNAIKSLARMQNTLPDDEVQVAFYCMHENMY